MSRRSSSGALTTSATAAASSTWPRRSPTRAEVTVEGAGHAVNLYQPEKFNDAVLAFLQENGI